MTHIILNRLFWFGFATSSILAAIAFTSFAMAKKKCTALSNLCTFIYNQEHFDQYIQLVKTNNLNPNDKGMYPVTPELRKLGISAISAENEFVFFSFRPDWPDDAFEVVVYDLKVRADTGTSTVAALMSLHPNRLTYHIQHVKYGYWLYWQYEP